LVVIFFLSHIPITIFVDSQAGARLHHWNTLKSVVVC